MPASFTVTNTLDDGSAGSLRWAINQANADTDALSHINFNIPGSGMQTIHVASQLPAITHPAVIDGYTQPGASPNTHAMTDPDPSDNAVLGITIYGYFHANDAALSDGLLVTASGCTLQGLEIVNFDNDIRIEGAGATNNVVQGDFIGTDGTQSHYYTK